MRQSVGAMRRAGLAVSRKIRDAVGMVEAADGVGEDEGVSGRQGSRAWFTAVEETVERIRKFLEESTFVRLSKLENFFRELVGLPPRVKKELTAPMVDTKPRQSVAPSPQKPVDAEQAARFRAQIQQGLIQANTQGNAKRADRQRASRPPPAESGDNAPLSGSAEPPGAPPAPDK
jgi:hypothetical protein